MKKHHHQLASSVGAGVTPRAGFTSNKFNIQLNMRIILKSQLADTVLFSHTWSYIWNVMFVRLKGSRMAPEVLCSCLNKSEPSLVHGGASVDRICSSMSCGCSDLDLGNQEVRLTSWVGVLLLRGVPYIYIFINVCTLYLPLKMNTLTWAGWSSGGRAAPPVEGRSLVKQFEHSVDWRSITEYIYILTGLYFKSRNSLTLTSERVAEIITLRTRLLLCLMDWGVNDFCPACAYIHPELVSKP